MPGSLGWRAAFTSGISGIIEIYWDRCVTSSFDFELRLRRGSYSKLGACRYHIVVCLILLHMSLHTTQVCIYGNIMKHIYIYIYTCTLYTSMILIYKVLLCDPCKVFHALCNGLSEPVENGNNHRKTVMTLFLFRMWTWEGCRVIFKVFLMSILHKDDVVIMRASSQMNKLQVKCDWIWVVLHHVYHPYHCVYSIVPLLNEFSHIFVHC